MLGLSTSKPFNEGVAAYWRWRDLGVGHVDADEAHTNPFPERLLQKRWDWFKGWQAALYAPRAR